MAHPQRNSAALAAIASGVALALGLLALDAVTVPLAALLTATAAYVASMTAAAAVAGEAGLRIGIAPLAAAALLLGVSSRPHLSDVAPSLRFSAALVPPPVLLVLGGLRDAPSWPLLAVAGLVSATAMLGAVRCSSNAFAVAGGIGILGVSVDIAARTLGGDGRAPVILIVSGLLIVGCGALTQQAIKHNTSSRPTPAP